MTEPEIAYGNLSLQSSTIVVSESDHDAGAEADIRTYPTPRGSGTGLLGYFYRKKTITLRGYLRVSTGTLQDLADSVKRSLSVPSRYLSFLVSNTRAAKWSDLSNTWDESTDTWNTEADKTYEEQVARRAKAYVENWQNAIERKTYHTTMLPFELRFGIDRAFLEEASFTSIPFLATTANIVASVQNLGTAPAECLLSASIISADGTTLVSFSSGGVSVSVSETSLSAGDILVFDGAKKTVEKNGASIEYSGYFPTLDA